MSQKKFLTAEWRKLIMANYKIDPEVLKPYLPAKTELDYFNGSCYVSLVGFMFKGVKVKGFKIPWHVNFPEVNLRFYVRYFENKKWKRGVVFLSEIVPKPAITFIANALYREHYSTMPMRHSWQQEKDELIISYQWKKNKQWNKLEVNAEALASPLLSEGEEEFITEHFWGYSIISASKTAEYHVSHPRWNIYKVNNYTIDCDFETLYGKEFGFLQVQKPDSVFLAEGSAIEIFSKRVV